MKQNILKEADFFKEMEETVLPYLAERRTALWIEREPGRKLYCERYLADEARGVAVLSHGFTETGEKYQENVYYFLQNHYTVYIPDHCGHGHSYRMTDDLCLVHVDRYERYVEDLLAVARLAKEEQKGLDLYLYGHSMGGGIAAALLAKEPALFRRAVLSSPMIRPLTGGIPWTLTRGILAVLRLLGKSESYVPGQHPFDGKETFESSPSSCRERYEIYQEKRNHTPIYQMSGASCSWLHEAVRLNCFLRKTAWKQIETPFLLFQAQEDTFVCAGEQTRFVEKVKSAKKTTAKLIYVPGSRHEIFNSSTAVLQKYWETIFQFFAQ